MTSKTTKLADVVRAVQRGEVPEFGKGPELQTDGALMALGLRAVLGAIGTVPSYRNAYVAKGGTVLRLMAGSYIGRFSTDLDLSLWEADMAGLADLAQDHDTFAVIVAARATEILQNLGTSERAEVKVMFERSTVPEDIGENPDTVVYRLAVEATLKNAGKVTRAQSRGFKIDVTQDEYVDPNLVFDLQTAEYGIPINVKAYLPIQSIAEKLRAILQKYRHNQWKEDQGKEPSDGNLQPRHLLDLATLYDLVVPEHWALLPELLRKKCARRGIMIGENTWGILDSDPLFQKAKQADRDRAIRAKGLVRIIAQHADIPAIPTL